MSRATRVLTVDPEHPDPAALDEAAAVIRAGGLVAFPTETVYGLGADATNPEAVARIYEAKGRPTTNPLIVHGDGVAEVRKAVAHWPDLAARLAHRFWPGPLTLVMRRSDLIPDAVTAGRDTVGVRVPDHLVAWMFLARVGRPVAAPSANRSTRVSPSTAAHVVKELQGRVDLVLDAGPTPVGIESTVLDLTAHPLRVLRPGAVTAGQIARSMKVEVEDSLLATADPGRPHASPGMSEVHYAPRALLIPVEADRVGSFLREPVHGFGLIVAGHRVPAEVGSSRVRVDWMEPEAAARELYATLHHWDELGVPYVLVVMPPHDDEWRAVYDRLWRASRRWEREGRPSGAEAP